MFQGPWVPSLDRKWRWTWACLLAFAAICAVPPTSTAAPVTFTDRTAFILAAVAIDAGAGFRSEFFTGLADSYGVPSNDGMNGLGAGPHAYNGFSITLNDLPDGSPNPDFGGSMSGIANETFSISLVRDNSDFVIPVIPPITVEGEGVLSATLAFDDPNNFAFGADFSNARDTNSAGSLAADGFIIEVNGVLINASTIPGFSGVGFLGIIDTDGISSLNFLLDDLSATQEFQDIAIDNTLSVDGQTTAVVPLPAALPLFGTGLALLGFVGWRRKRAAAA